MKFNCLIILFLFYSLTSLSNDKRILKLADQEYNNGNDHQAIKLYKKVINQSNNKDYKAYSHYMVGYINSMYLLKNDSSFYHFGKSLSYNSDYYNNTRDTYYRLAQHYNRIGLRDSAMLYYSKYNQIKPSKKYIKEIAHTYFLQEQNKKALSELSKIKKHSNTSILNYLLYNAMTGNTRMDTLVSTKKDSYLYAYAIGEHRQ